MTFLVDDDADRERVRAATAIALKRKKGRLAALVDQADTLAAKLNEISDRWQEARERHGEAFPSWAYGDAQLPSAAKGSAGRSMESVDRQIDELAPAIQDLKRRVATAQGNYARQSSLFGLRATLLAASELQTGVSSGPDEANARREAERQRRAEETMRLLDRLQEHVPVEERAGIEKKAQEAINSTGASRRRALVAQLQFDIQQANEAGRARRRVVEQVEEWRERLLELDGPDAKALDQTLQRALDGDAALPADIDRAVEQVVAQSTLAFDRAFALGVVAEELENLNYVLVSGMDTSSEEPQRIVLRKPDMGEYHVTLEAEPDVPLVRLGMVREQREDSPEANQPRSPEREELDHDMERMWYEDFAFALAAADRRGVHGRVVERDRAGRLPVPTMPPAQKTIARPARRRRRSRSNSRMAR